MMRSTPRITVVIPVYNREKQLPKAIDSVLAQSYKKWHILIIDDYSTDATARIAKQAAVHDKRISYYRMPKNMGLSHVMNKALELVNTEYMLQLDSDDWLEKIALKELVKKMDKQPPTTALAYGNYMDVRNNGKKRLVKRRGFLSSEKYEYICYGAIYPRCYRTSCLREVGGWPVDNKQNGRFMEDRQITFKLIEKFDFLWIDKHLYNLWRGDGPRATDKKNKKIYHELKKELVTKTLKKWGNEYVPQFEVKRDGWLQVQLKEYKNRYSKE